MKSSNPGGLPRPLVQTRSRAIGRPIIDNEDIDLHIKAQESLQKRVDVLDLVVRGDDDDRFQETPQGAR